MALSEREGYSAMLLCSISAINSIHLRSRRRSEISMNSLPISSWVEESRKGPLDGPESQKG